MANNRSTRMRQRVQNFLKDPAGLGIANPKAVYDALNRAQVRICEEAAAYETQSEIEVTSGTELYDFPDGMIYELAIVTGDYTTMGTSGTRVGKVSNRQEALVHTTNTTITFDTAFTKTYTDLSGASAPSYRFFVESAYVTNPAVQEEVYIVSKSLTNIVLKATSDNTIVRFRAEE